jgi:hypothetical protein
MLYFHKKSSTKEASHPFTPSSAHTDGKRKRTRPLLIGLLCLCTAFCLYLLQDFEMAHADVIWEPQNDFYESHAQSCDYVNRTYTVNGPGGQAAVYESPESSKELTTLNNGLTVFILFSYTDSNNNAWGVFESSTEDVTGWVAMDYLKLCYDSIEFQKDYAKEFVSEAGTLSADAADGKIYFWDYPGSDSFYECPLADDEENKPEYQTVFTDEAGHKWGLIAYYFGYKNVWSCLDAPSADFAELFPDGAPARGDSDAAEDTKEPDIIKPANSHQKVVIIFLIAAVLVLVVVTAAFLILIYKKNARKKP